MAKTEKSTSSRRGRKHKDRAKLKPQDGTLGLSVVHPKAAGIDVGNAEHYVAVPPHLDAEPVRVFGCFTADLIGLADWLEQCGIETVAMQPTGVYWMALYDLLEERGIRVFLVNARDTKNMPGRKSDVQECQWLLKLHVYGLLKNSFRPEEEIRVMRTLWRQRQQHIGDASRCIQRMQKALTQMNLQLSNVISDIGGWTGQSIIRAILSGQRDPRQLAQLRDPRVKASETVIAKSLEGNWRGELLFVLKQEFASHQSFQHKIQECDEQLQEHLQRMEEKADPETLPEYKRNKRPHGNVPDNFDLRDELYRITGVDLTSIDSVNGLTAQTVIAEVGYDMSRWETEGRFVSWLNLAPKNKISGGKVIGRDQRKVVNRAGQALRQAASTLLRSQTYLGAQYRRLRAKLGAPRAVKAMAGKLARIIYRLLKHGQQYVDKGSEFYEQKYRQQQIKILTKKAAGLGLQLVQSAYVQHWVSGEACHLHLAFTGRGILGALSSCMSEVKQASSGYPALLGDGGFQSFLWTQFLGAFNDNVYKMIVSVAAVEIAASQQMGARYLSLAGAVFVIPFLLFAGYAGQLADRFSKTRVLQVTKAFEILIMITGLVALVERSMGLLLTVLFLLAVQANFFSPAKYGILPETLGESQLTRANGLLELSTFAAIVLGTSAGAFLFAHWKAEPSRMGLVLLAIAVVGSLTSLRIPRVAASGSREPFHWNPFAEIWAGSHRLLERRDLWLTVAGISYFWFLGALFQLTVILFGSESLHASDDRVGLLVTALAIGIGAGSVAAGWFSSTRIELGLVPWGAVLLGGCALLVGSLHSIPWIGAALVGVGFGGGLFIVPLNAYLQDRAEAQEKGRVLATNNFFNMIGVVLASGVLSVLHDAFHWQPAHILEALGIFTLGSTFCIVWLMPAETIRFALWCTTHLIFRVRVIGAHNIPHKGGAVIVSNHVSYADAVLIGCSSPRFIRFLMWQPYFENPWLKPLCSMLRAMPIPTGSPKEVVRALRRAQAEVEAGRLVCIFPEGNLTRTGHVMAFERGVERIAGGAGAPIIPIYLDGLWGHRLSRKPGASFRPLRRSVTVYVGEPITHETTADELRQRVLELGSAAVEHRKTGAATLSGGFIRAARRNWSALALADSTGRKFTFGRALTAALLFKRWVTSHCADDTSVGLLFPASVGGALANLGVTLAGKTAVNLNFTAGAENMRHSLERCEIRTVISSRAFLEKAGLAAPPGTVFVEDLLGSFRRLDKLSALLAARLAPARSLESAAKPADIAAVIFSSGSTGTPKGVMLSHWNLYANAEAAAEVYSVGSKDRMLGVLPFFHSFGYTYTLWFPLLHGFAAVFHPNPTDAKTIGELAGQYHPTLFLSTPTFCLNYVRKCTREQFSALRYLLVGAEKLRPSLVDMFEEKFGVTPLEGYGCTEMGPVVSVNTPDKEHGGYCAGSVGRPLPGVSLRIVDPETLASLPSGQTGLLLAQGPSRMVGYLGDADRTERALCEGYYVTGDLAYLDKNGFLHIVDRLARFSKIAGEMVPHLKIEEALSEVVGAGQCIVVGVPDERRGERLAVLYTSDDVAPPQMVEHLTQAGLPPLWIPKRDQFYRVEAIPLLGTGKVDLMKARALAAAQGTEAASRS